MSWIKRICRDGGPCSVPVRKPQGQSKSHHMSYERGSYQPCVKDSTSRAPLSGQAGEAPSYEEKVRKQEPV